MALIIVHEDGTGKFNSNSYVAEVECDSYHEAHLYGSAWTGASGATKAAALAMATRIIDGQFQFGGKRTVMYQALQWPRTGCRDPDADERTGGMVESDAIPQGLIYATCETARALIIEDRTANPLGEGLKFTGMGDMQQAFDKKDRRPMIPHTALALLAKFGERVGAVSGAVRLTRT